MDVHKVYFYIVQNVLTNYIIYIVNLLYRMGDCLYNNGQKTFLNLSFYFICENNRKSNKIMHCIDFFWLVILKIWAFFTYLSILLSVMGRYNPPPPH